MNEPIMRLALRITYCSDGNNSALHLLPEYSTHHKLHARPVRSYV